jgi:dihydrofolate reductase
VDGFIAREDGSFDWALSEGEHFAHLIEKFPETFPVHLRQVLGVSQKAARFDTVLMGRKTYEVGVNAGIVSPYEPLRQFVVSHSMPDSSHSAVRVYRGAALDLVHQLKAEEGKDIWLCGGAQLAAGVFTEIDELILKINPVVIGAGTPLFGRTAEARATILTEYKVYANGFVFARYDLSEQKSIVF